MTEPQRVPVAIVYQNSDFVGSLIQAVTGGGLAQSGETEFTDGTDSSHESQNGFDAQASGGIQAPGVANVAGRLGGKRARTTGTSEEHRRRHRLDMSYDISYHFHQLRSMLADQTKTVADTASATGLVTGDIVTFTGRLEPDPISAVLDIASPELAAEIARYVARRKRLQVTGDDFDVDELRASWESAEQSATTNADLARAVTSALHTDFRRRTTIEYHATIGDALTGIVVCENEHFVTADPDRLLDGEFTVLGKVVTSPETNTPVLRKNKLLRRLNPQWVAWLFDQIGSNDHFERDESYQSFLSTISAEDDGDETAEVPPIDLNFPAIIEGVSFVVLPIAIFA
ncbi:DUF6414 family protein [Gordonia sihwensis]|uniref:DUF6414 family protein n=1 Tax=Gordonia sihwensis TaxID=173559 RepID=UPI002415ACD6|nr:hypothetical protein [Gordonia sihwensis]WFN93808.1 hypothetical protein P5P27_04415 [Gordonia sihwensis]